MSDSRANFAKAIFFILLAIFLFDVQGAIVKYMGDRFPVEQLATFRNIFGLIPTLAVLALSREWHDNGRQLMIRQWRFALLRGFYVAAAQFSFYLSLVKMELATATTLTFIGPVFITLLSIIMLKHRVGVWRWVAVVAGFLGVLLIMRPGSEVFTPYALLPIGASFGYSLSVVSVRLLDDAIPTATIILYASVGALIGSGIILLFTGRYIAVESAYDWFWLIALGTVGGFAVLCLITAYRLTRPGSLSPFEFFGIPFSFALGWIFFDETPFDKLLPGVYLIVAGGMLIAWRERKKQGSRASSHMV
ncbi:MAG: DMT family transporter [Gammaproteobacteria bacterium]